MAEIAHFSSLNGSPEPGIRASLEHAREIVAAANHEAATLRAAAERDAENIRCQALDDGLRAAESKAADIITAAIVQRSKLQQQTQRDLLELCCGIAEQVVADELTTNRESILKRISRAIGSQISLQAITIAVHPDDERLVREQISKTTPRDMPNPEVIVQTSADIPHGDAKLVTDSGRLRICVADHLAAIRKRLVGLETPNPGGDDA